jgi:hypothetical protein
MKTQNKNRLYIWGFIFSALAIAACVVFYLFQSEADFIAPGMSPLTSTSSPMSTLQTRVTDSRVDSNFGRVDNKATLLPKYDASMCQNISEVLSNNKENATPEKILAALDEKASVELDRKLAAAITNGTQQDKAAALYFSAQLKAFNAQQAFEHQHPKCEIEEGCQMQAMQVAKQAKIPDVNQLAKLAIYSQDAQVYAMAFHSCGDLSLSNAGFCKEISARQWAARDPDNGSAWLYVASQAEQVGQGKKNTELENAMFQLSQAKKFDQGLSQLSQFQKSTQEQAESMMLGPKLIELGLHASMNVPLPTYKNLVAHCSNEAMRDSNRRQICDALANKLISDQGSRINLDIGAKLGQRLGWTPDKLANLREEQDAMHELDRVREDEMERPVSANPVTQFSQNCVWRVKYLNEMEALMQFGENALFRKRIAEQKISRAELAANYRAYEMKLRKEMTAEKSVEKAVKTTAGS